MVQKLRSKPGGDRIEVVIGDFAEVEVEGRSSLAYVPLTTFFALPTQDAQIRCLTNVTAHLEEDGHFVVDAFVPDPARFTDSGALQTISVGVHHVVLDASRHDPVNQRVESAPLVFTEPGTRMFPVSIRYCWPAELDVNGASRGSDP